VDEMRILFPIQFIVQGTAVSSQAKGRRSIEPWKERIRTASSEKLPEGHFAAEQPISVTIYCFPNGTMEGDIDNIIKPILDAMKSQVYIDDKQVERVVAQKFDEGRLFRFDNPSSELNAAITGQKPLIYVKVSDRPQEELQ
jgi:crossover junction endodeoxyribonuclease RusA